MMTREELITYLKLCGFVEAKFAWHEGQLNIISAYDEWKPEMWFATDREDVVEYVQKKLGRRLKKDSEDERDKYEGVNTATIYYVEFNRRENAT